MEKIVGFKNSKYAKEQLGKFTGRELYDLACNDEDSVIIDITEDNKFIRNKDVEKTSDYTWYLIDLNKY